MLDVGVITIWAVTWCLVHLIGVLVADPAVNKILTIVVLVVALILIIFVASPFHFGRI